MESIEHFFSSFWQGTNGLEVTGFICAILYALFASYEKVWCWPFAIISTGIFIYIYLEHSIRLQAVQQLVYFIMAIYGWYAWAYEKRNSVPLHVVSYPANKMLLALLLGVPVTVAGTFIVQYYFIDKPRFYEGNIFSNFIEALQRSSWRTWLDSFLTIYSLIATWLMARKVIQNWLFWMIINPLSIIFFTDRGRYLIVVLYIIYTMVAIFGYFKWRQQLKVQAATS